MPLVLALGATTVAAQSIRVGPPEVLFVAPGDQVTFPIQVDMSAAGGLDIASLQFELGWNLGQLGYVGDFPLDPPPGDWTTLVNRDQVGAGALGVGMFSFEGTTSSFDAIAVTLEAGAGVPDGTWSRLDMRGVIAGDAAGSDVSPFVSSGDVWLCVGLSGILGDVNCDGVVNIVDAQQIARYAIGLSTPSADCMENAGDVNDDGVVNIIDAQQVARHALGLPVPLPIGQPLPGCEGPPGGYDIDVRHLSSPSPGQLEAFAVSAQRWMSLVIGEIPDVDFTGDPFPANACGIPHPAVTEVVDDLLIFAVLEPIDGPGGILGAAGPCYLRDGSWHAAVGIMFFDTADLDMLEAEGLLGTVIVHEMGHIIGIGTIWREYGYLQNPSDPNRGGIPFADTHFNGPAAIAAFDDVGGTGYTGGEKVPVENDNSRYGTGSLDSHWRESVFNNELMTPSINLGTNPLSIVTVASLQDVGYLVELSGADPYTLPGPGAMRTVGRTIVLEQDVWYGPRHIGDTRGRVIRTLHPQRN
jgi:hypothetical protein